MEKYNETIAKFLGFSQSGVSEDYWYSEKYGYTLLKFDKDWEWLMYAVLKVQEKYDYRFTSKPYDLKKECELLSNFILKNGII